MKLSFSDHIKDRNLSCQNEDHIILYHMTSYYIILSYIDLFKDIGVADTSVYKASRGCQGSGAMSTQDCANSRSGATHSLAGRWGCSRLFPEPPWGAGRRKAGLAM